MREPIFVFGSNQAGRHGKGDALIARNRHGAIYGQGEGLQGSSYGVTTKDRYIRSLPLSEIAKSVARFIVFATEHPELNFEVMALGCRLAGYLPSQIAPMFKDAPNNCYLHPVFIAELKALGLPTNDAEIPRPKRIEAEQGTFGF